jgi:hypothetical protein
LSDLSSRSTACGRKRLIDSAWQLFERKSKCLPRFSEFDPLWHTMKEQRADFIFKIF